jgi:hypothetical protein
MAIAPTDIHTGTVEKGAPVAIITAGTTSSKAKLMSPQIHDDHLSRSRGGRAIPRGRRHRVKRPGERVVGERSGERGCGHGCSRLEDGKPAAVPRVWLPLLCRCRALGKAPDT